MSVLVIKRDGRKVPFDKAKIIQAVLKAFVGVDEEEDFGKRTANAIAHYVEQNAYDGITVEEIQDMVEQRLMASNRKDVAKAYILYRNERNRQRNNKMALRKKVLEKLSASDVQNSNANMDERTFGGRMGAACSEVTKDVALNDVMSDGCFEEKWAAMLTIHDIMVKKEDFDVSNIQEVVDAYPSIVDNSVNLIDSVEELAKRNEGKAEESPKVVYAEVLEAIFDGFIKAGRQDCVVGIVEEYELIERLEEIKDTRDLSISSKIGGVLSLISEAMEPEEE